MIRLNSLVWRQSYFSELVSKTFYLCVHLRVQFKKKISCFRIVKTCNYFFFFRNERVKRSPASWKSARSGSSHAVPTCQRATSYAGDTFRQITFDVTTSAACADNKDRKYFFPKNNWQYTNGKSALWYVQKLVIRN